MNASQSGQSDFPDAPNSWRQGQRRQFHNTGFQHNFFLRCASISSTMIMIMMVLMMMAMMMVMMMLMMMMMTMTVSGGVLPVYGGSGLLAANEGVSVVWCRW